jgi:diguanylate cyclase (GGDEF)-like protein
VETYDFQLGRKVTLSIGLSTMKEGEGKESLIKTADNALYIAKESGRNKVTVLEH